MLIVGKLVKEYRIIYNLNKGSRLSHTVEVKATTNSKLLLFKCSDNRHYAYTSMDAVYCKVPHTAVSALYNNASTVLETMMI